jgi:hypothetical protein
MEVLLCPIDGTLSSKNFTRMSYTSLFPWLPGWCVLCEVSTETKETPERLAYNTEYHQMIKIIICRIQTQEFNLFIVQSATCFAQYDHQQAVTRIKGKTPTHV